jgi:hypothetical protein
MQDYNAGATTLHTGGCSMGENGKVEEGKVGMERYVHKFGPHSKQ